MPSQRLKTSDARTQSARGRLGYLSTCRRYWARDLNAVKSQRQALELLAEGWPPGAGRTHARVLAALERTPAPVTWHTLATLLGLPPGSSGSACRAALMDCRRRGWVVTAPVKGFKPGWPRFKYSLAPAVALARLVARNQREGV